MAGVLSRATKVRSGDMDALGVVQPRYMMGSGGGTLLIVVDEWCCWFFALSEALGFPALLEGE